MFVYLKKKIVSDSPPFSRVQPLRACIHMYTNKHTNTHKHTDAQAVSDQTGGDCQCNLKSASFLKLEYSSEWRQDTQCVSLHLKVFSVMELADDVIKFPPLSLQAVTSVRIFVAAPYSGQNLPLRKGQLWYKIALGFPVENYLSLC